jgi:hypothetical protein
LVLGWEPWAGNRGKPTASRVRVTAAAARRASAPTVGVGLGDAFLGKLDDPTIHRLSRSQLRSSGSTAECCGDVPMTAPPARCEFW